MAKSQVEVEFENGRPVIYPTVSAGLMTKADGKPLTVAKAKELLGWNVGGSDTGCEVSVGGKKYTLTNNINNRPLNKPNLRKLMQEILRKRWRLNGEPIIIGRTGLIENGQHTLLSLILAAKEIEQNPTQWSDWEGKEPTIDKVIVYGIAEDDYTINTLDTGRPRDLGDVIARSVFFRNDKPKNRTKLAKIAEGAVKTLWWRTGQKLNAFAPLQNHSESMDFIERHPRILEAVRHIFEENGNERKLSKQGFHPGTSAGFLYLMGCCKTNPKDYFTASPEEDPLNWDLWDKACDFWTKLAGRADELKALREVLVVSAETGGLGRQEKLALLVKTWEVYSKGQKITKSKLELSYLENDMGIPVLDEWPACGGIDLGDPTKLDEEEITRLTGGTLGSFGKEPTEEQVAAATETIRGTKKGKKPKPEKQRRSGIVNKPMWVDDPDQEPWRGKVRQIIKNNAEVEVMQGFQGAGNVVTVPTAWLTDKQPLLR